MSIFLLSLIPLQVYTQCVYTCERYEKRKNLKKLLDRFFGGGLKNGENPGG
jgi:hypothetical protein